MRAPANGNSCTIKDRTDQLVKLLDEYDWVAENHVTDFYVQNVWEGLPLEWREHLGSLSIPDALAFSSLSGDPAAMLATLERLTTSKKPIPSSLASYLDRLARFSLPRNDDHGIVEESNLGTELERGMTPKKLHEVCRLARIIWEHFSAMEGPRPTIVDVGSGVGHLARVLAVQYGFDVVAVEGDSCHVQSAIHVDTKANRRQNAPESDNRKQKSKRSPEDGVRPGRVQHVAFRFGGVGGGQSLVDIIRPLLAEAASLTASDHERKPTQEFVLVGLHACGDLVPQMLEAFKASHDCRAVFAVSCCYMKVSATGAKPSSTPPQHRSPPAAPSLPAHSEPRHGAPQPESMSVANTSPAQTSQMGQVAGPGDQNKSIQSRATQYLGASGAVVRYPMSAAVSQAGCPLGEPESDVGYHMREQACHALEAWTGRAAKEAVAARAMVEASGCESVLGEEPASCLSLRNHCWRAVLEQVLADTAERAPEGWRHRGLSDADSLRRCLWLLANGGGRGRLAGVNREKVTRHKTFSSYARAVLRRANCGEDCSERERDWVDDEIARLDSVDLDREYGELLAHWHRPVIFYVRDLTWPRYRFVLLTN